MVCFIIDNYDALPLYADASTGMWFQVLDCPYKEGNYLEATCNAMFVYAMLKGIDDSAARIAMAQRWSQDVCRQLGNNISDELVAQLKS